MLQSARDFATILWNFYHFEHDEMTKWVKIWLLPLKHCLFSSNTFWILHKYSSTCLNSVYQQNFMGKNFRDNILTWTWTSYTWCHGTWIGWVMTLSVNGPGFDPKRRLPAYFASWKRAYHWHKTSNCSGKQSIIIRLPTMGSHILYPKRCSLKELSLHSSQENLTLI